MKKIIFLLVAAVCTFVGCNPAHEDIGNGSHITVDELKAMTSVIVDKVVQIAEQKTYTATQLTPIVLMENVDVKDCESVALYFGEAIPDTCWEVSLTGEDNTFERIPKNVLVYRCDFGNKVKNGVVSKIVLRHIKDNQTNTLTVKAIYKNYGYRVAEGKEGLNGNVITCYTSAPVNAKWSFAGKEMIGNFASKKMTVKTDGNGDCVPADYTIKLTALCPDGTELVVDYPVQCKAISNPLVKYYIYGDPNRTDEEKAEDPQLPFVPGAWDAAAMRFSSTEGAHLPTIPDEVYFGLKTLIFDVSDVTDNFDLKVMNGWWSNTYYDHVKWVNGLNELPITQTLADECAKGGEGRDLDLMLYSGSMLLKTVYYEE